MKAKEYAAKQREMAARKAQVKKNQQKEAQTKQSAPQPHAYKNTHAVTPDLIQAQKAKMLEQQAIEEVDHEESEVSVVNIAVK